MSQQSSYISEALITLLGILITLLGIAKNVERCPVCLGSGIFRMQRLLVIISHGSETGVAPY